jgi:hypothetical protein
MASEQGSVRPRRFKLPGNTSQPSPDLPSVPEPVRPRSLAPNWSNPTEGNGTGLPRDILHIALIAPSAAAAEIYRRDARLIQPPLWKGKVQLHIVTIDPDKSHDIDPLVLQAMVDLGFADSTDIGLIGYPEGHSE